MKLDEARAAFRSRDAAARQRAIEAIAAGEFAITDLELGKHQAKVVGQRVREIQASGGNQATTAPTEESAAAPLPHKTVLCGNCAPCLVETRRVLARENPAAVAADPLTYEDGTPVPKPTASQLLRHAEKFDSGQAVLDTARKLGVPLELPAGTVMKPAVRSKHRGVRRAPQRLSKRTRA